MSVAAQTSLPSAPGLTSTTLAVPSVLPPSATSVAVITASTKPVRSSISGCPVPISRTKTSRPYQAASGSSGRAPSSVPTQSGSQTGSASPTSSGPVQQTGSASKTSLSAVNAMVLGLLASGLFFI